MRGQLLNNEDSSIARGNRLRKLRQMAKLTSAELAERASISRATISYWENALHSGMTKKGAERIIQVFNDAGILCTFDWLWFGIGSLPIISQYNQYATNLLFNKDTGVLQKLIGNVDKEISLFIALNHDAIILKIEDPLMAPVFEPGDMVGGLLQPLSNIRDGMNCIIKCDQKLYARIVRRKDDSFTYDHYDQSKSEYLEKNDIDKNYYVPIIRVWKY